MGRTCVTCAADIIELLSPLGVPGPRPTPACGLASSQETPADPDLNPESARVLDAMPARGSAWPATLAVKAGLDLDTVLRCLGLLAGCGFIERRDGGWRRRHS